jgi:hypothetical protein
LNARRRATNTSTTTNTCLRRVPFSVDFGRSENHGGNPAIRSPELDSSGRGHGPFLGSASDTPELTHSSGDAAARSAY